MAFIDELEIELESGRGGDGVVRWRREKNRPLGGPAGGNGGRGGHVYLRAVPNLALLARYRMKKKLTAERGEDGEKNGRHGGDGGDLYFDLPVGSIVTNTKTGEKFRLDKSGEVILALPGGHGGRGNESYKSFINRRPKESTPGGPSESATFSIEVELIADVGLVGLPNAGKTSLLNALTNSTAKVGEYPFTTLEPNLGQCYNLVIADIPGLIEGAAEGKGLGHKFLRHIRRTRLLVHVISLEGDNLKKRYDTVKTELVKFDPELGKRPEFIVLTKSDLLPDEAKIKQLSEPLKLIGASIFTLSNLDDVAVGAFRQALLKHFSTP